MVDRSRFARERNSVPVSDLAIRCLLLVVLDALQSGAVPGENADADISGDIERARCQGENISGSGYLIPSTYGFETGEARPVQSDQRQRADDALGRRRIRPGIGRNRRERHRGYARQVVGRRNRLRGYVVVRGRTAV